MAVYKLRLEDRINKLEIRGSPGWNIKYTIILDKISIVKVAENKIRASRAKRLYPIMLS